MRRAGHVGLLLGGALLGGALLAAAGCSDGNGDAGPTRGQGSLRVIHVAPSAATLDVLVDGGW